MTIRVLLAEDHTIVRKGLRSLLETEANFEIVGEAENGRQAIDAVIQLRPDVVVMDIAMPEMNGLEATRQIKNQFAEIQIVILSMHSDPEYVLGVLQAGASGYVIKRAAPTELVTAIRAAHAGESFLSPAVSRTVIDSLARQPAGEDRLARLTPREREVLQLVAEGHSSRQIAELWHLSIKTVESHRSRLMEKLDIHTTAELTQFAIAKGVISLTDY